MKNATTTADSPAFQVGALVGTVIGIGFSILATSLMICPPITAALLAFVGASYIPTANMFGNTLVVWEAAGPWLVATSAFVLTSLVMSFMSSNISPGKEES